MALTIDEFIEKWTKEGEEDVVGEGLTLNRGPALAEHLPAMQEDVPEGTQYFKEWGFGDDKQRLWFNPIVPFFAGFSELSHSIHVWRYPNRLTYIKQVKEVGDFFSQGVIDQFDRILEIVQNPESDPEVLEKPVRDLLTITRPKAAEVVLGHILDTQLVELQVEVMMAQLR